MMGPLIFFSAFSLFSFLSESFWVMSCALFLPCECSSHAIRSTFEYVLIYVRCAPGRRVFLCATQIPG